VFRKTKILFPILITIISIYVSSCANQSSPQGGPRDTIPPIIITSLPENKSLNYTDKVFEFQFDERINADQRISKMIITPRTENKFKVYTKKNLMILTFEENFGDTTTYTLNFADGVGDITENNPVENFSLAFSTGPTIDSIYINGNVKNIYNNLNQKNILIALFDIDDTLNIFTGKPKYFTKTNEEGNYRIENIKNGNYKLYAFLDDNKNLTNEPATEPHGFMSDTLKLAISLDSVQIKVQLIDASQPRFVRAKTTGRYFDILYNKYCKKYSFIKIDSTNNLPIPANHFTNSNTIIRFYNNDKFKHDTDSLQLAINFYDSLNNQLTDTVFVKFRESKRKKDAFTMKVLPTGKNINENLKLSFTFNKPIKFFNKDSLILKYDTIKVINIPDSTYIWNKNKTTLTIQTTLDKSYMPREIERIKLEIAIADSILALTQNDSLLAINKDTLEIETKNPNQLITQKGQKSSHQRKLKNEIRLYIPETTFISIDNDSSEVKNIKYKFKEVEDFGILSGKITTTYKNYFLQLTDPKYNIIRELKNVKAYKFIEVKPGKYTFRIMIDSNNDGKWSSGNILKNIEPEPVWFYPEVLDIRANWEVENLDISF